MTFVNLLELEAAAQPLLAAGVFDYFAGGAGDELTLVENRRAFDRLALRPRTLVDVSQRDAGLTLFGARLALPVIVAPMAMHRLAHPDGELAVARATRALGTVLTVSTLATVTLEDIHAAAAPPPWFQLYVHQDRDITTGLLERVHRAGYGALVLTVDTPVLGRRERDVRNAFRPPVGLTLSNAPRGRGDTIAGVEDESGLAAYFAGRHDASVTWADLDWIRRACPLPLLLKGVLRGDDAARAADHGVDGVIVSNHGGRQLDTTIASVCALPDVVEGAGGRIPVLLDGGVRRGTDILKAIALGATAVMVGRPVLWALAVGGESGVARALGLLRDELDVAMAVCGCPTLAAITRDLVTR